MRYTCAIIFFHEGKILIGHTTGQKHWDLPKGKAEEGETFAEAAVRECMEETGYAVLESDLFLLGEVDYQRFKKLVLFFHKSPEKPIASELKCTSTYTSRFGIEKPELDAFMYIDVDELDMYLTERMCLSIKEVVNKNSSKWSKERTNGRIDLWS